jgi:hypothetical protein
MATHLISEVLNFIINLAVQVNNPKSFWRRGVPRGKVEGTLPFTLRRMNLGDGTYRDRPGVV